MRNLKLVTVLSCIVLFGYATSSLAEEQWWKGNTHTHSWWSDGDSPPELIARWYKAHDYNFLVLSDHNTMQAGEKWYPVDKPRRRPEQIEKAYKEYKKVFGNEWVEERTIDGMREVKLKTLDEFRSFFEEKDQFIFIKGEEITDRFEAHPVHLNGVNLVEHIEPRGGISVVDAVQNNIDAVLEQSKQFAQPMVVHVNHPNFHYAQTAEDFFYLNFDKGEGFFEMYNGHSGVDNYGDEYHQSTERMWDIILSKRLGELRKSLIYGVATDDAHEYTQWGVGVTNPGRGWIMVKSDFLTPNKITEAIKRGDFYNSTGVELSRIEQIKDKINIQVVAERGVDYTIEFIGTEAGADLRGELKTIPLEQQTLTDQNREKVYTYSEEIGKVLKAVDGTEASYKFDGDEMYVRVRVTSSKQHPNPFAEGDVEMAWSQPFVFESK